jgi:hypothetical protein
VCAGYVANVDVNRRTWVRTRWIQKAVDIGTGGEGAIVEIWDGKARRKGPIQERRVDWQ